MIDTLADREDVFLGLASLMVGLLANFQKTLLELEMWLQTNIASPPHYLVPFGVSPAPSSDYSEYFEPVAASPCYLPESVTSTGLCTSDWSDYFEPVAGH